MSTLSKETTFIPCEPFEADIFDIHQCKFIHARINGYNVAIRDLKNFQTPSLLNPIELGKSEPKHGIIAVPAFDEIKGNIEVTL